MNGNPYAYREGWRTQIWSVMAPNPSALTPAAEQVNGMLGAIADQRGEVIDIRHQPLTGTGAVLFLVNYRVPVPDGELVDLLGFG